MNLKAGCRTTRGPRREHGFTMVEALVALVILAIGLLGIAALYLDSLRGGRTALYRTTAVSLASDLADRIRSNRDAGAAYTLAFGDDTMAADTTCDAAPGCDAPTMAETDLARWRERLVQTLPGGDAEVTPTVIAGEPTRYLITVRWTEPGTDGPIDFVLSLQT